MLFVFGAVSWIWFFNSSLWLTLTLRKPFPHTMQFSTFGCPYFKIFIKRLNSLLNSLDSCQCSQFPLDPKYFGIFILLQSNFYITIKLYFFVFKSIIKGLRNYKSFINLFPDHFRRSRFLILAHFPLDETHFPFQQLLVLLLEYLFL